MKEMAREIDSDSKRNENSGIYIKDKNKRNDGNLGNNSIPRQEGLQPKVSHPPVQNTVCEAALKSSQWVQKCTISLEGET